MSTNREVLWEVVRPVLAWPMRSPVRLGLVVACAVVVLMVFAQVSARTSPGEVSADEAALTTGPSLTGPSLVSATSSPSPHQVASSPTQTQDRVPAEEVAGATAAPAAEQAEDVEQPEQAEDVEGHDHEHPHESGLGLGDEWLTEEEAGDAALVTAETVADEQIVQLGVDAVAAMARPAEDVDEADWWEEFSSHLTSQGRQDYEGVDPRSVPWSSVSGGALLSAGDHSHLVRMVEVKTDRGPVVAHVAREGEGWAVSRLSWDWFG